MFQPLAGGSESRQPILRNVAVGEVNVLQLKAAIAEVVTRGVCDQLAGGEVKVQEVGATPTQVQSSLVRDLSTVGQNQLVDEMTVFGERLESSIIYVLTILQAQSPKKPFTPL